MAIKDTDRKARANYKKKVEKLQVELYPTDEDIKNRITERIKAGEPKATYIKRLIRADIEAAALSDDLKRFKEKLYEERMKELKKGHFVSEEKRKEFQDRLDAGEKPAELFKLTRQKKSDQ